jgi:hypothetical protein
MILLGCLFLAGIAIAPRVMLVLAWLFSDRWAVVWNGEFLVPLLGIAFLPFTMIMYMLVWTPTGVHGWDWMWILMGLILDLSHWGQTIARRKTVPGYEAAAGAVTGSASSSAAASAAPTPAPLAAPTPSPAVIQPSQPLAQTAMPVETPVAVPLPTEIAAETQEQVSEASAPTPAAEVQPTSSAEGDVASLEDGPPSMDAKGA